MQTTDHCNNWRRAQRAAACQTCSQGRWAWMCKMTSNTKRNRNRPDLRYRCRGANPPPCALQHPSTRSPAKTVRRDSNRRSTKPQNCAVATVPSTMHAKGRNHRECLAARWRKDVRNGGHSHSHSHSFCPLRRYPQAAAVGAASASDALRRRGLQVARHVAVPKGSHWEGFGMTLAGASLPVSLHRPMGRPGRRT